MSTAGADWDPYAVLGVSERATQAEIELAWRRALRASHPDRHPGDAAAIRQVKEVLRAGEVLRDPERRARFDRRRDRARGPRHRWPRRPTWSTLAWDGGSSPASERTRLPHGIVVIHR